LYDYVWYLLKEISVNLLHLEKRLIQTGHLQKEKPLTNEYLLTLLTDRFNSIDYDKAKQDVLPFIKNPIE
jgi:hypothetical protein